MPKFQIKHRTNVYRFSFPEDCPICHRLIVTPGRETNGFFENTLEQVFRCPNPDCQRLFLAYYDLDKSSPISPHRLIPYEPTATELPPSVEKISEDFVSIYKQALEAKDAGLDQIAGPGFRKAFEFLIKDYAKSKAEDERDKKAIDNSFAGNVVKDYIEDERIQAVSERALWLGNDETHYLRKWADHDIDDLINLIRLTIHWIEIEQLTEDYVEEMPEGGPKNADNKDKE